MKKTILILVSLSGLSSFNANAALIVELPFADADGTSLSSAGTVSGIAGFSGSGTITTTAALSYAGVGSSGNGLIAGTNGRGFISLDTSLAAFAPFVSSGLIGGTDTGTIYISVLARGWLPYQASTIGLSRGGTFTEDAAMFGTTHGNAFYRNMTANSQGGSIDSWVNTTIAPSSPPTVDFIVAKITFGAGNTDTVELFFNQASEGAPDASSTGFVQFDTLAITQFTHFGDSTMSIMTIDEIRIGTTFAAVIPEPSNFALVGLTALSLVFKRRRCA